MVSLLKRSVNSVCLQNELQANWGRLKKIQQLQNKYFLQNVQAQTSDTRAPGRITWSDYQ
jgi:predicted DNA-binding WGR domain protein